MDVDIRASVNDDAVCDAAGVHASIICNKM